MGSDTCTPKSLALFLERRTIGQLRRLADAIRRDDPDLIRGETIESDHEGLCERGCLIAFPLMEDDAGNRRAASLVEMEWHCELSALSATGGFGSALMGWWDETPEEASYPAVAKAIEQEMERRANL